MVRHKGRDTGDLEIRVVPIEQAPPAPPKPDPIAIPESLRGCHSSIHATQEAAKKGEGGWISTCGVQGVFHINVSPAIFRRALLVLQAIVAESERRGYRVQVCSSRECRGLGISINGHVFEIAVFEETQKVEHVATAAELRAKHRNEYFRIPQWDHVPSGKLAVTQGHQIYSSALLAADRERWTLDERLPYVLVRIEEAAAAAEEAYLAAERKRLERRIAWERAIERAKASLVEHHRASWLAEQLAAHQRAVEARRFVAEVRAVAPQTEADEDWFAWVSAYADRIDPIGKPLAPPPAPSPTAENLRPFLGNYSFWPPD